MNILTIISAVLISAITPVSLPELEGIKDARAVFIDDQAIVAVIPEAYCGIEAKNEKMRRAAERLGEEWDKEVVLTDDLLTYMILSRIEKRGADDYERKNLAARLSKINAYCYTARKVG